MPISYGSVTPTGSTAAGAALVKFHFTIANGADDTKGIILPRLSPTISELRIFNNSTTKALKIYPATGNSFKGYGSTFVMMANQYSIFTRFDLTNWAITDPGYILGIEALTAAGSTQSDATQASFGPNVYSCNSGNPARGIKLPNPTSSAQNVIKYVINLDSAATFKLYPSSGFEFISVGVNTPITIGTGKLVMVIFLGAAGYVYLD